MTYYEQKARQIRDHCLSHPWTAECDIKLVILLEGVAEEQRLASCHAIAKAADERYEIGSVLTPIEAEFAVLGSRIDDSVGCET